VAVTAARFGRHRATFRRLYRTAGRYLPPARLAALARTGFVDAKEGQEREVSILLVDLVGFTSFSNEQDRTASEVVKVANRYFSIMQAIIDRHGGCSDKFLGDAVLAFWNGFADEPAHALKAITAAHEIIAAIGNTAGSGGPRLEARAVVCSGWVYVGDLGSKDRSNFTIIGPAVNETFRLEKLPDAYGLPLLVAASTRDLLMRSTPSTAMHAALAGHTLVRIDEVELKGFSGRRSIYALVPSDARRRVGA
jgi:adenylate cyclase